MDAVSEFTPTRDGIVCAERHGVVFGAIVVKPAGADNDESCAALYALPVVFTEAGRGIAVLGVQMMHGRHDDAVFQLHAVDGDGGKESAVFHGATLFLGWFFAILPHRGKKVNPGKRCCFYSRLIVK